MRMKTQFLELPVSTHVGQFTAYYSKKGLTKLNFPRAGIRRGGIRASQRDVHDIPTPISRWHHATVNALKDVLAGQKPKSLPALDLSGGTKFQQNVWHALRKISRGQTRSYGQIARQIGRPRAVRAVGCACGANPIPIFVPCHRVLAANGRPGGFSGGLNWKRRLLAREGVSL